MIELAAAIEILHQGGVIAYPTEAVYGLGCDPLCESAVLRLLALKKRAINKGLILIAANIEQITPYIIEISSERMQQIYGTWPGPFTWVFPATPRVPKWIRGDHNTVAVRVTDHPIAKILCRDFGRLLVSTSANLEGQPPARDAQTVKKLFSTEIDMIIEGQVGGLAQPTEIRDAISGQIIR